MTRIAPSIGPGHGDGGVSISSVTALVDLPDAPTDGELAIVRVGTYPNIHEELLKWNAGASAWLGDPQILLTQNDIWSMDLGNKNGADITDWCFFNNPNPNSRAGYNLTSGGALNLSSSTFNSGTGTGVITVVSTTDFASSGSAYIRDNVITYTGKTATTLTGCTVTVGTRGSIPNNTDIVQGFAGGFGTVSGKLFFAHEFYALGLRMQEVLVGLMNGDGTHALIVAPYWYEYEDGDGSIAVTEPPTGGLGFGATLTGPTAAGAVKPAEREFTWKKNDWATLSIVPTKRYAYPRLFGKMDTGSTDTGQILDITYRVRWVYVP